MAYQGPPGVHRGLRKRALEFGTNPEGFEDGPNYDPQAGHPVGPGMPGGAYRETPPQVTETGAKPINPAAPFTLGGK